MGYVLVLFQGTFSEKSPEDTSSPCYCSLALAVLQHVRKSYSGILFSQKYADLFQWFSSINRSVYTRSEMDHFSVENQLEELLRAPKKRTSLATRE